MRALAREHPSVTSAFLEEQDAEQRRMRQEMAAIRKAFGQDKERKAAIKELLAQQEKLKERQRELARASTIVECEQAVKSWDLDDLGQGHALGGAKHHKQNRIAILDRIRHRSKPLPADLANDWNWFLKHWDAARVAMLMPLQRTGWASDFVKIAKKLLSDMREDPDALAKWMRHERRQHLSRPALQF